MKSKKTVAELIQATLEDARRDPGPHPAFETLSAFLADGLETSEAEQVREHLEDCSSCAEQVSDLVDFLAPSLEAERAAAGQESIWPELRERLASDDPTGMTLHSARPGVPPSPPRPTPGFNFLRWLADFTTSLFPEPTARRLAVGLAIATLVAGISLITALRRIHELRAPRLNVVISTLESPAFTRDADRSAEPPVITAGSALILIPYRDPEDLDYRLEMVDEDGKVLFTAQGLIKNENGNFHILLPAELEASQTVRLRIFAPGVAEPFDEFTARLTASLRTSSIFRLAPGNGEERRLDAGTVHTYLLDLAADEYAHLIVDQRGTDVVVSVIDPAGRRLFRIDTPTGSYSDEHVFLLGDQAGTYRVEVRAFDVREVGGAYVTRLASLRPADELDRLRAAAERAFAEARELERENRGAVPDTAVEKYLAAADSWRRLGDAGRQGDAVYRLAKMHREAGRPLQSATYHEQARELFDPVARSTDRALNLNDLGMVYVDLGKMAQARSCFEEALRLHRQKRFMHGVATTLVNLGKLHHQQGRVRDALELFEEALPVVRELGFLRGQVAVLNHIGAVYTSMGETRLALDHHQQARDLVVGDRDRGLRDQNSRDHSLRAIIFNFEGNAHLEAGDLDAAFMAYTEAQNLAPESSRSAAVALAGKGLIHDRWEEGKAALAAYGEALAIFEERGERPETAIVLNNLGWLEGRVGEAPRAIEVHRRALELARELDDPVIEAATLFGLARIEQRGGDLTRATELLRAAIHLIESRRDATLRSDLRVAYLASRQAYYHALVELLMEQHRRQPGAGYDTLAFDASEAGRARHLLELLAEDRERLLEGLDTKLLERRRELGEVIQAGEEERRERFDAAPGELKALERKQRLRLADYQKIEAQIRRTSPWYAALHRSVPLTFQEIRERLLDDETLLLVIHLGEPRSYLWAVTSNSQVTFELPGRNVIEAQAHRAHTLLVQSHHEALRVKARQEAAELSRMLLGPVVDQLDSKQRLVVIAQGALHYVPFAALPEPRADHPIGHHDPPLIERHQLVHLPSVSVLGALRSKVHEREPEGLLAVVADPVFGSDDERLERPGAASPAGGERFERLVHTRREAEAILALAAPRGEILPVLDFDANRELVLSGVLGRYRLLHFATHGVIHATHPELSALILSRVDRGGNPLSGWLPAREIYELDLAADLVVLSGCETALGREFRGEGILGLTQGFLYAGANAVLVSLWKVSDQATAELMERFYRAILSEGMNPAEALRRAQEAMRHTPRWEAPYFWAGFMLLGDWL